MNAILIFQILFFLILLRIKVQHQQLISIVIMTTLGTLFHFYGKRIGLDLSFDLMTLLFFGTFMLALTLKQKENLLIIAIASFSMYPTTLNQSFFLQTLLLISLYTTTKEDLGFKEKLGLLIGLIVWPSFFIFDNLSFSYEVKFICAVFLSYLLLSRAQKIDLKSIAFYSLVLAQILFFKGFDYHPVFSNQFAFIMGIMIVVLLISKRSHSFIFPIVQVLSLVFCGIKTLPFFTSYYTTLSIGQNSEFTNSRQLTSTSVLKLIFLILVLILSLATLNNFLIAVSFILLLSLGKNNTFFKPLELGKISPLEILTYFILILMNVFVVFYV